MRELIRPALFLVARLGLFLSVAAWIVGQWRVSSRVVLVAGKVFHVTTATQGLVLSTFNMPAGVLLLRPTLWPSMINSGPTEEVDDMSRFFAADSWLEPNLTLPGFLVFQNAVSTLVAIRHWLIVTIFVLFYGVLKWVYRKRGTEVVE